MWLGLVEGGSTIPKIEKAGLGWEIQTHKPEAPRPLSRKSFALLPFSPEPARSMGVTAELCKSSYWTA